jgi:hypothetical protein
MNYETQFEDEPAKTDIAFAKLGVETGCGAYFTTAGSKVADLNKIAGPSNSSVASW